jgi:hypothetical protein
MLLSYARSYTYRILLEVRIWYAQMRVFHLAHHRLVHVRNGHLVARYRVRDCRLRAIHGSLLILMRLRAAGCGSILCSWLSNRLPGLLCCCSLLVYLAIAVLLVLVQVLDKLLHSRDGVVARVVASRRRLLRGCHVVGALSPPSLDESEQTMRTSPHGNWAL